MQNQLLIGCGDSPSRRIERSADSSTAGLRIINCDRAMTSAAHITCYVNLFDETQMRVDLFIAIVRSRPRVPLESEEIALQPSVSSLKIR